MSTIDDRIRWTQQSITALRSTLNGFVEKQLYYQRFRRRVQSELNKAEARLQTLLSLKEKGYE